MKIKGLLLGMFACAALVACTDNDMVENTPDVNSKSEKAEVYLTFSIATSGNSSRATTIGDSDGNEDDSGHYNTGTANENNVESIAIVFYNADDLSGDGIAVEYNTGSASNDIKKNDDGTYSPSKPYQLSTTGNYKTLVIINPNATISGMIMGNSSGAASVKSIYDNILEGSNSDINDIIGTEKDAFMMTNRQEVKISVDNVNNSPENAASGYIEVERVASKITFRPVTLENFTGVGALGSGANVYQVNASHTTYMVTTSGGWVPNGNSYIYYDKFNKATTNEANVAVRREIYVLLKDGEPSFYTMGDNHTGYVNGQEKTAPIMVSFNMNGKKPIYQGTFGTLEEVPYYVRLERYALVNLNNAVYNVRHTNTNPANEESAHVFGIVGSTNYLFEPNTQAKSVEDLNVEIFTGGDEWFGRTAIYNVETAISKNTTSTLFTDLPQTYNDNNQYVGGEGAVAGGIPEDNNVGSILAYCMENAVVNSNQSSRLTTGIFFEAQIYDTEGEAVPCMYKFGDSFYKDLKSLNVATSNLFSTFLDENNENGELDSKLSAIGVEVFRNGKCYYFSSEIKHFDNNSLLKGVMEYAIMRNNIYSLKVDNVNGFGFASTEIVPGETGEGSEDQSVYLTLKASILPWIVRFNGIEF